MQRRLFNWNWYAFALVLLWHLSMVAADTKDASHIQWGAHSERGKRDTNEDAWCIGWVNGYFIAGVYDGFGGDFVSNYLAEQDKFYNLLAKGLLSESSVDNAIRQAYAEMDKKIVEDWPALSLRCGSCAAVVIFDQKNNKLIFSNVGDSEIITIFSKGTTELMTTIHRPAKYAQMFYREIPEGKNEIARIQRLGGIIHQNRVQGNLLVSRAFGVNELKKFIIPCPHVNEKSVSPDLRFVVIASDGLWDVLAQKQVAAFITDKYTSIKDPLAIAQALVAKALTEGSDDNVTAIVLILPDVPKGMEKSE